MNLEDIMVRHLQRQRTRTDKQVPHMFPGTTCAVRLDGRVFFFQALEKKKEEQRRLHEENMRINAETIRAKEQRREEEKLADRRDREYIQKKLVRWKNQIISIKSSFMEISSSLQEMSVFMASAGAGSRI